MDVFVLVAARDGVDEQAGEALRAVAGQMAATGPDVSVSVLRRAADDPFGAQYPTSRAYEWVLHGRGFVDDDAAVDAVSDLGGRLDATIHADLSGVLVGRLRTVTGDGAGPVRFVYLMRRKAGTTTDAFQAHWAGPHAEFGRQTTGILGYDQFHPVPELSRRAAAAAGLGVWQVDGVPNLHLRSWQEFVAAAVGSEVGNAAIEDERSFVDGPNSVGFVCDVVAVVS